MLLEIEHRIDPDQSLDPIERRERAEAVLREQYRQMGRRSGESRRQRAARLKDLAPLLDAVGRGAA
jgi:hypothetical protein